MNMQKKHNMKAEEPFFSIVIPTCGRPGMLERALNSLKPQQFRSFEVIVVDDRPGNHELEVNRFEGHDIRVVRNTGAHGVANARNLGIANANAKWVLFLDDDDELEVNYLSTLYSSIGLNPDINLFWSGVRVHYSNGTEIEKGKGKSKTKDIKLFKDDDATYIGASYGVAIQKSVLQRLGGFDTEFPVGEDTELFTRLLSDGVKAKPIPEIGMIKHETHDERLSADYAKYSDLNIYEKIFRKHNHFFRNNKVIYRSQLCWATLVYVNNGNFQDTKYFFSELLKQQHYWSYINLGCYKTVHHFLSSVKKMVGGSKGKLAI